MAKPIAIVSSDWHYHIYKKFNKDNSRTITIENFIYGIFGHARKLGVPILFSGDFTHTPKGIPTELSERASLLFRSLSESMNDSLSSPLIGISGNHELQDINTPDKWSPSQFRAFANSFPQLIKEVDFKTYEHKGLIVAGIPYINHNKGLEQEVQGLSNLVNIRNDKAIKILLLHSDVPGAVDTNGRELNTHSNLPKNLGKFFKGFDIVFFGHIHKHQKLWTNIYMVGAPMQQRKSDEGCEMGYLILYDDLSIEFVKTNLPEFKSYNEGEPIPDDFNYWVPIPSQKKQGLVKKKQFHNKSNKTNLAIQYLRETGIKSPRKREVLIKVLNESEDKE